MLVRGTSCHCVHRESSLLSEALSAQNDGATQDLAHPFSHERGFMPMLLHQSSHFPSSVSLVRRVNDRREGEMRGSGLCVLNLHSDVCSTMICGPKVGAARLGSTAFAVTPATHSTLPLHYGDAQGAGRLTMPPTTSRRRYCLPSSQAHQHGLELIIGAAVVVTDVGSYGQYPLCRS